MIEKAELIFFDMDGTLYEGVEHYNMYASLLRETLPVSLHEQFTADYNKAMSKQSPLRPGTIYLKEQQWIVAINPFTLETLSIHQWNGQEISDATVDIRQLSRDSYVAIGDPWWIPYTCAVHLGATPTFDTYEKTKEIMLSPDYPLLQTNNLKANLAKLKQTKTLICITNSYSEDARSVLEHLELIDLFAHVVAPGNKPKEIQTHFKRYINLYQATPATSLSIGDNVFNEIAPAIQMGMPSILLSTWGESHPLPNLKIVPTLADMI